MFCSASYNSYSPSPNLHAGRALSFVNKNFFEDANGNRGSAPNVAIVMVDGWPTDKVEEASRLARESGINIFFVTIEGPDENEKQNVIETNFVDKVRGTLGSIKKEARFLDSDERWDLNSSSHVGESI